jgi:hypothetical protein
VTTPTRPRHCTRYDPADLQAIYQQLPDTSFTFTTLRGLVEASPIVEGRGPVDVVANSVRNSLVARGLIGYLEQAGRGHTRMHKTTPPPSRPIPVRLFVQVKPGRGQPLEQTTTVIDTGGAVVAEAIRRLVDDTLAAYARRRAIAS